MERPSHPGQGLAEPARPGTARSDRGAPRTALTGFFGRDLELERLRSLLAANQVVTITGPGGSGKTRLATELALELSSPVWIAELAEVGSPRRVAPAVAAATGVLDGLSFYGRIGPALAHAEGLLILDNCEHLIDACAQLAEEITTACPGVRVLATSREPLRIPGEAVLRLGPLALSSGEDLAALGRSPAIALFVDRAVHRDPEFKLTQQNCGTVWAVCRQLDGLPLAIELAAARLGTLSLEDLHAQVERDLSLLSAGSRTAPVRHRTLLATLEWSYGLLTPPERDGLLAASVFAGRFSLEFASAVLGHDASRLVPALVERSLLQLEQRDGHGTYLMLDSVRRLARQRLDESGAGDDVRLRHARAVHAMLSGPNDGSGVVEARIRRHLADMRQALRFLIDRGDETALDMLAKAIVFFGYHGYADEGKTWLDEALERLPGARGGVRYRALMTAVATSIAGGDLAGASSRTVEAEAEAVEINERVHAATTLGLIAHYRGHYDEAVANYERALALDDGRASPAQVALTLANLGWTELARDNVPGAQSALAEARSIYQRLGHAGGLAAVAAYEADVAVSIRDFAAAERLLDEMVGGALARDESYWVVAGQLRMALLADARLQHSTALAIAARSYRANRSAVDGMALLYFGLVLTVIPGKPVPEVAAQVAGAIERARMTSGFAVPSILRERYDASRALARSALGSAAFERVSAAAASMPLGAVIEAGVAAIEAGLVERESPAPPGLSGRERQVLALVVTGASNKEIAIALAISPRTVERHLANLYARIGARGRADAIAWALLVRPDAR